ncbi:MAG TPA: hypothetical protein EYG28_08130 [Nitrospiria bacterium]|nr:hypothetical protein [Candidatus Manganitrophaceae bacterium]HIL35342.1 hypothetical protein [Candidatus Manganitrophaceae bacterium]
MEKNNYWIRQRRGEYNNFRPHSSLEDLTPVEYRNRQEAENFDF